MVYVSPDVAQWNPYNEEYANVEDRRSCFRGDLAHRQPKCRNILNDSDIIERVGCSSIAGTSNINAQHDNGIIWCNHFMLWELA